MVIVVEQDVSAQVHSVPVKGHIGDVHLIINFKFHFDVPKLENEGEGGGGGNNSSGGAGFDVGVDDWADVNVDIPC